MIRDNEQRRISDGFAAAVNNDPRTAAECFLERFNFVLSPELASRMCPAYNDHPQFRGYYRSALAVSAQKILDYAWTIVSAENKSERKPILFIVGAGPGSLHHELLEAAPKELLTASKCVYDITSLSVNRADDLIRRTLQQQVPAIVVYVHLPLPQAAEFVITTSITEGLLPSAADFSARQLNCYNTFLALIKRYKNKTGLFSSALLLVSNNDIVIDIGAKKLKRIAVKPKRTEEVFVQTWNRLQNSAEPQLTQTVNPAPRVKRPRFSRDNSLRAATADAAWLLAQSLSGLVYAKSSQKHSGNKELSDTSLTSRDVSDNPKTLTHDRAFASNDLLENATGWSERTQPGQDKLLNEERPLRIVVEEKKTHEHEMQIIYTR